MDPFRDLVSIIDTRMATSAGHALDGVPAELGTITATGLKLDNFKHEIQDYLVADWLVMLHLPSFSMFGTSTPVDGEGNAIGAVSQRTKFEFESTVIEEVRGNFAAGLLPGERVLVLPTNRGNEMVVICRVVSS